ncbi:hypothetical protein H310_12265 [Aphanomyces invadans]|uniref:Uncharacterized protein n=1 Tax=Aphanomyces invadans TaxID=157072 RepID=A0A024TKT7_9STRA|nr:hypothetical protein H310_12265 [Aphanomyces invadans]ETV93922.1 hypothetical protein H310_12265 [Aphanomyces invadans]|eukprot:XP_008877482.1 hypothetical protein H310_12265 [Aphanomyces invadans]
MRTRSRTRAAAQRQQCKDDQPVNITVNIHIHVAQNVAHHTSTQPPLPRPRYFTRLQRQRLAAMSSAANLPAPDSIYLQPVVKNTMHVDQIVEKTSTTQRRPAMENPKTKRRRVDVDALLAELTSMSMGSSALSLHHSTLPTSPRNPFSSFTFQAPSTQDLDLYMDRCHVQPSPSFDMSLAVSNLQLVHSSIDDEDVDAALSRFTSMTLHDRPVSESHFLHHLLEKRLSLRGS